MSRTLRDAYHELTAKGTFKVKSPFIIWLFENPASPLALPGSISLDKHDYMHCLLDKNLSLSGEAYVLGFTMGADPRTNAFHIWFFKILSCYLYPKQYRFRKDKHWKIFLDGFVKGRASHMGDAEKVDFARWLDQSLDSTRAYFLNPTFRLAE